MKTTIILSVLASLTVKVFADLPPACLLNAVNTQDSPGDLSAVCGDEAQDVQSAIASMCNSNVVSAAQSAFISTCSVAGTSVAPFTATSTSNSTASTTKGPSSSTGGTFVYTTAVYNSDCSCTSTIVTSVSATTGVAVPTDSNGASATGASSSSGSGISASGNAAADTKQVGSFAAAVIAIAGIVAFL